MNPVRVMDEQQDCILRLQALYEKFKKEPIPRRTQETLARYDQQRITIWTSIEANDKMLSEHAPPEGYDKKMQDARSLNEKFIDRLKLFGFDEGKSADIPTDQLKPCLPPFLATTTPASTSKHVVSPITTTTAASMIPEIPIVSSQVELLNIPDISNKPPLIPTSLTNGGDPNASSVSWNQTIDAGQVQQGPSITQLLCMLAENQKEVAKLAAQQISTRHLEPSKIEILPFDGNVKQYRQFRDMFGRAVSSCKWSNIDLFMYLQSKLTGDAYNAIAALEITDETYFLAWEILDRRFNNKRKLLEATLKPLLDANFHVEHNNCSSGKAFMSTYQGIINNLKQYKATIEEIIMELLLPRMNETTRSRFEDHIGRDAESQTPSFEQLDYFFEKELRIWSNTTPSSSFNQLKLKPGKTKVYVTTEAAGVVSTGIKCFICQKNHVVQECEQFLSSNDRIKLLKLHKICIFCTKHRYNGKLCNSKKGIKCDICQDQHITLMHPLSSALTETSTSVHVTQDQNNNLSTVLPTAVVTAVDLNGNRFPIRCLVDLCAERSYVCESVAQLLRLKKHKTNLVFAGINGITGRCNSFVKLLLQLTDDPKHEITVDALVVPKVTGLLPNTPKIQSQSLSNIRLADPPSNQMKYIGALLGGDIASKLFVEGIPNRLTAEGYLLQPTHMGWIVSGSSKSNRKYVNTFITINESSEKLTKDEELSRRILAFYELPEPDFKRGDIDDFCEELFLEKHYRKPDGRYVVPIPWKADAPKLGHSYRKAVKMFTGQESKWRKNIDHYEMSNAFMQEYEALQHMTLIDENVKSDSGDVYYIPYLSILRKDALTTKLRNVFNASMPSSNGISLNDQMWEGPKLQTNIRDILITARAFKYIYSADISKMFRQIQVLPEDRDKLRIIWRPSVSTAIKEYKLNTVTYGTDSAPFLAIRTIHQTGIDNASPEIAAIIKKAFYVDDLLYGADTINEAIHQMEGIKNALSAGQFSLTKWMSNSEQVLTSIKRNDQISSYLSDDCHTTKLLGVLYDFKEDRFQFNLKKPDVIFTKRGISSASASFYDPMGFLLPLIMFLRLFLQKLWRQKFDWDETVDELLQKQFEDSIKGISKLNVITIPRYIPNDEINQIELIGFSDASNNAQAAVIYCRIATVNGYDVTIVTAKGNVTKLKTAEVLESQQCTIPKMELEALVTLCELYQVVRQNLNHRNVKFTAYTDSLVVLSWIRNNKRIDKKFIERRVTKIRNIISPENLHYVKSEENPADPASRGLSADQLSSCDLWFLGPSWLHSKELPLTPYHPTTSAFVIQKTCDVPDMLERFSDWERILRVVVVCLRWKNRQRGNTTADEIIQAKCCVIRYYQHRYLADAIDCLQKGKLVPKKHWLYRLSPFLDVNNLLRVGGRLGNAAEISESQRHPIVIPKCHALKLLVNFTHLKNGHCGNSLMMRLIIEEYWIPGIKNIIKSCIRKCTTCIRWNARPIQPHMSQLPEQRVTSSSTFNTVGLDLCGPFTIKASSLRFDRTIKVWVVNFVCFSTKATHLELVTSLSTEHFIAAFTRFCSRRGVSSEVWSDNGTNLIGANRMLKETWEKAVKSCEIHTAIQEVRWKFIPRHSPTFGGLWEAGVKSLKYFTKRMENVKNLTYEEFTTLLCRIEALLNSRPLHPNPLSPEDEPALTPFHFLNQRGYKPSSIDGSQKVPLTKKWILMHQIHREFWQRFKTEYLRELQVKSKWIKPQPNLTTGDVVLLKEPSMVPGDWKMGRVSKTFPDPQGVVRKVEVITSTKDEKIHAVNQLVPLLKEVEEVKPQENNEDEDNSQGNENNSLTSTSKPRRSSRIAAKVSLVHLCLLTLFVSITSSQAMSTEQLTPGFHIRKLGDVYLKSFNLDFSVKTTLNASHDIELIQRTVDEFYLKCTSLCKPYPKIVDQCSKLHSNIGKVAQHITSELNNRFKSKTKRWISLTSKGILKAAPMIAAAGGMVYQETEIWNLKKQVADAKNKMVLTANALLNITEIEYETIEGKLNEVIAKQQEVLMEETVLSYAQNVELLLTNIKLKHETITDIQPYDELMTYIEPLLVRLPTVQLPNIGRSIFEVYPPTTNIQNDVTVVSFTIPLVLKGNFTAWSLIASPNHEGRSIIFGNKEHVQNVIVNENNNTYAEITKRADLPYKIYEDINLLQMSDCLKQIFSNSNPSSCNDSELIDNKIVELYDDLVVVFTTGDLQTTVLCDNQKQRLEVFAAIVNTTECTIITKGRAFNGHHLINITTNEDDIDIASPIMNQTVQPLSHSPIAIKSRSTLKEELDRWTSPDAGKLIIEILVILLLITSVFICTKCFIQSRQSQTSQTRWFPEYIGPTRMVSLQSPDSSSLPGIC